MGAFLFFRFRITNVKLINENNSLTIVVSKRHRLSYSMTHCVKSVQIRSYFWSVFSCIWTKYGLNIGKYKPEITPYLDFYMQWNFLYLACFVVNTYVTFIWECWILIAYASSTTCSLTKLPHVGLYNYNWRQIELFYLKWFNCG